MWLTNSHCQDGVACALATVPPDVEPQTAAAGAQSQSHYLGFWWEKGRPVQKQSKHDWGGQLTPVVRLLQRDGGCTDPQGGVGAGLAARRKHMMPKHFRGQKGTRERVFSRRILTFPSNYLNDFLCNKTKKWVTHTHKKKFWAVDQEIWFLIPDVQLCLCDVRQFTFFSLGPTCFTNQTKVLALCYTAL